LIYCNTALSSVALVRLTEVYLAWASVSNVTFNYFFTLYGVPELFVQNIVGRSLSACLQPPVVRLSFAVHNVRLSEIFFTLSSV